MYIACSSLCFGKYSLDQALRTIEELHFAKVDLIIREDGPHVRPSEILEDVNRVVLMLRKRNQSYAAFHADVRESDPDQAKDLIRSICRLGRLLTVPVLSIPAAPLGSDLDLEIRRLSHMVRLAVSEGIILTVETHRDTVTADPLGAIELCKRVPGLGLTLDPTHYLMGPHHTDEYDDLYPYIRHVRLRDSKKDRFQVKVGQGELEYAKFINQLARNRYDRAMSVDIRDLPETGYPLEPEVRKLKYLLESMI